MPTKTPSSPLAVAGVDEAGRGALAGPVVAAAVILGTTPLPGLADSKRLTASRREELFVQISAQARAVSYAAVSPRKVDAVNVLQATFVAMRKAVAALPVLPCRLHVDGNMAVPGIHIPQWPIVGGDAACPAVSAASIVAKVVRDRMMHRWGEVYPGYDFANHKGYGTRSHTEALARYGPCRIHRFSFAPVGQTSLM